PYTHSNGLIILSSSMNNEFIHEEMKDLNVWTRRDIYNTYTFEEAVCWLKFNEISLEQSQMDELRYYTNFIPYDLSIVVQRFLFCKDFESAIEYYKSIVAENVIKLHSEYIVKYGKIFRSSLIKTVVSAITRKKIFDETN